MHRPLVRGGVAAVLAVLGLLVGVVGAFTEAVVYRPGGVVLPVGLVITLAGCLGLFVFGGRLLQARMGAVCPAAAWFVATLVFLEYQPHEDAVFDFSNNAHGFITMIYVLVGVVIAAGASYTPWTLLAQREAARAASSPSAPPPPATRTPTKPRPRS